MNTRKTESRRIEFKHIPTVLMLAAAMLATAAGHLKADTLRRERLLTRWEFRRDHRADAADGWKTVDVPHDWAIEGPFDRSHDLQETAVVQNGETVPTVKTGRTGGLPYTGEGCYRTRIDLQPDPEKRYLLLFDGAMSEARVTVNRTETGGWPYGYNAFWLDITDALQAGENRIAVFLRNRPHSSRWYPGAGLYRKVRLLVLPRIHIPVWGTQILTPYAGEDYATVTVRTPVEGLDGPETVRLETILRDASGRTVAARSDLRRLNHGQPAEQHLTVPHPERWSPENPALYTAETRLYVRERLTDSVTVPFGIRSIELRPDRGFFLNGKPRKFRGVCLHHDLGPLGAAVHPDAVRYQLTLLKEMGCDAVRTAHNMPAEELVRLCDEMGLMLMVEPFDEWDVAKCENGYHRFFGEWAEKDLVQMVRHFRNNPSVVMWSIGNEVPTQWSADGYRTAARLQEICRREDPSRPVTCGMDQFDAVVQNGFAAVLDLPGFNYKVYRYEEAYALLPQNLILGSETASTVSSRGVYHFPVRTGAAILHPDHQSSSYDTEYCSWSNLPDADLAADEDFPWVIGQFVWTGFDYLGEPTPYDTDSWPSHSSMFGIIDLASIPKDRYWLYRSVWNRKDPTLHVLPHWTWPGREGEVTPVFVYTSWPEAELFINGVSQGRRSKNDSTLMHRYRLMWNNVRYRPGEIRVVAYDSTGKAVGETFRRTAGKARSLVLECNRKELPAGTSALAYLHVRVTDPLGTDVPTETSKVRIRVRGDGRFRAMANGDPTCLEPFQHPEMSLFGGRLTAIVESTGEPGEIIVEASAPGLQKAVLRIPVR